MFRSTLCGLSALMLVGAGHAQSMVMGSGDGHACYLAVENGDPGKPATLRLCTRALSQGGLVGKDRAATIANLGVLHLRRGDYVVALRSFDRAIAINPSFADAYINRGASLIQLEQLDLAVEALSKSLQLGTTRAPEALYNRALALEGLERYDEAYADLTRSLSLRPEWAPAERTLARYVVNTP